VIDALPPHLEAEAAVLGSVLYEPSLFREVSFLKPGDFYLQKHCWVWSAFCTLASQGKPIDDITVTDELKCMGKLEEIGGESFLLAVRGNIPDIFSAPHYARIVQDYALRRRGLQIAGEIAVAAVDLGQEFDLPAFTGRLMEDARISTRREGRDVLGEIFEELYESRAPLIFGLPDMDERLGGLFPQELTVLAGDQGSGKSAFMLWMARKNAEAAKRVMIVSLEMKTKTLYLRMACGDLGVSLNQVRSLKVDDHKRLQVWELAQYLEEKYREQFIFYEDPMTLTDIQAAAFREKPELILIDHVGLISGQRETRGGVEKIDQMNAVNRFLRQNVAKPLDCHVVLLWQLNRSPFRENREPTKHDLFMAGTQDPDSILLLHRADLYKEDTNSNPPGQPVDLKIILGKARNDATGSLTVKYDLKQQSFHGIKRSMP
jgi:replicative DNA helicase